MRDGDLPRIHLWNDRDDPVIEMDRRGDSFVVRGPAAVNASRAILAWTNRGGGSSRNVSRAVGIVEARDSLAWPTIGTNRRTIASLDRDTRLAVEIASNEHVERRAMNGELAMLERGWRDAEKIAAIADDLLVPQAVRDRISGAKAEA